MIAGKHLTLKGAVHPICLTDINLSYTMKNRKLLVACLSGMLTVLFFSCKTTYEYNAEGMQQLTQALEERFGADAWYTGITIRTVSNDGTAVIVEETKDPNSLKQVQWMKRGDSWEKVADVALQIHNGKPQDYMFQLGKQASLTTLNNLMQQCREKLAELEQVTDAEITFASIKSTNEVRNRDERILYTISFHAPANDKSYSFVFDLNGKLKDFNK